jgi:hypothetical protein
MSTLLKQSSSSSRQPYSFSGSIESPFNIGGRRWVRLLLLTVVLYLALLPLWWYSLHLLAVGSGTAANLIYGLFDPHVSIAPEGSVVRVLITNPREATAQAHSSALRLDTVTYGLPMLAALVIVTRADSIRRKALALLAGLGVMAVLTVPVVMAFAS